ncbi:MAG: hypothetical protein JWN23_2837 [Rhodocyclales bacterium]|nr:hypothetical protein [Rhodocyclales bacterium]
MQTLVLRSIEWNAPDTCPHSVALQSPLVSRFGGTVSTKRARTAFITTAPFASCKQPNACSLSLRGTCSTSTERAKAEQPDIRCQFGGTTTEPESRLIAESQYLDLATFDVSEVVVAASDALAHASVSWPTRAVLANEVLLYGGYPGLLRVEHETTADMPFQWFAGAPISVTPENVKLHLDLKNFHQPLTGSSIGNLELGGMSGGPVFRLVTTPIERLELVAFIYESSPSWSLVFARPSHYITEQGQIDENAV